MIIGNCISGLTYHNPVLLFYTPWKHQRKATPGCYGFRLCTYKHEVDSLNNTDTEKNILKRDSIISWSSKATRRLNAVHYFRKTRTIFDIWQGSEHVSANYRADLMYWSYWMYCSCTDCNNLLFRELANTCDNFKSQWAIRWQTWVPFWNKAYLDRKGFLFLRYLFWFDIYFEIKFERWNGVFMLKYSDDCFHLPFH